MFKTKGQEAKETAQELGVQALMIDSRKIAGLECGISGLEAVHEKLEILLAGDITDYFDSGEDMDRLYGFNRARVCLGIIRDYMERAGEELGAVKELLQECRESVRVPISLTDAEIWEIYRNAMDDWPEAGKEITKPLKKLNQIFNDYLDAVEDDAFFYGFRCALQLVGG